MANMLANPKTYAQYTGIAVGVIAVLGIILTATDNANLLGENFLAFDWTHNIVHVVLACVALLVGYTTMLPGNYTKLYAQVFGIVYVLLGVVGFIPGMETLGPLHLELGENLVHLLIGAWGVFAGFFGAKDTTTAPTPTPARPRA